MPKVSLSFVATYHRFVHRFTARKPEKVLVDKSTKWLPLVHAWRDVTRSTYWSGTWKGPGVYRLSGYNNDRGYPVATVTWDAKLPQMEFNL